MLQPGNVVDERFVIDRSAGAGGMGAVYRAKDIRSDAHVALKVLATPENGSTESGGSGDRFAHEVELLAALEHPHIVGYVAHGVTESGAPYLVMPWLEGEDLQRRLTFGPLSYDATLTIARHVADALAYLHGRGVVHRDLKPSNLFLPGGKVEEVQVIDLGIARTTIPSRPLTLSGVLVGTPGFMAPEQARGDRVVAPGVDVFALGCVLFECLTGRRLFDGSHVMAVLAKILLEEPLRVRELLPDVPEAFDLLVHRMVSKDPERRPKDGAELGQWLTDLRRAAPVFGGAPRTGAPPALTATEQRVVTVLVLVTPPSVAPPEAPSPATRREVDPLRSAAARFGVRVQPLADGTAIAVGPERLSAADQATLLARFGRHIVLALPEASVAMATGSAVTGARLPVGEAVERCVRIVRSASPRQGVHLDDLTAALITTRFDIRRTGALLVVEDERLSVDPTRPLLGRPTSCVGRERELSMLEATFAACIDGPGSRAVLVTAASGAGKSRLRHELVRRLGPQGAGSPRVLHCRGDVLHLATPYALIAQAVRQAVALREGEPAEESRAKLEAHVKVRVADEAAPRVAPFLGELLGVPFDDEGHLQLRAARHSADAMTDQIRMAFEDALRAWCREQPIILVLEDLHWADPTSVKVVDGALRRLAGEPLFVLALARPEVHERFPGLWAHRDVTELRLPPLPSRACERFVRDVMGSAAEAEDVGRIVERSEGNAFYLEELIRAAAQAATERPASRPGKSERADDHNVAPLASGGGLPETMIAVSQARLERLDPRARKFLRAASVFGRVFWLEGVAALVGEGASELDGVVRALVDGEAIVPAERARFPAVRELTFRHALLRGAAYATLTADDRALGHRLAAEWLAEVNEEEEVIALHWLEGGDRARAAAAFADAGTSRWQRAHADAAARCMMRALLVGDARQDGAAAVLARVRTLADALFATRRIEAPDVILGISGHVDVAEGSLPKVVLARALDRARAGLREIGTPREVAETLAYGGCSLGALADFAGAKEMLAEAAALAPPGSEAHDRVRLLSAQVAYITGEFAETVGLLRGVALPQATQERIDMLLLLATGTAAERGPAGLTTALQYVAQAEELAEGLPVAIVMCKKARFLSCYFGGDHRAAAEAAEEGVASARRAGLRYDEAAQLHNAGEQHLRIGDFARAREALTLSLEIAHDIGTDRVHGVDEALLAYIDGREGVAGAAERLEGLADRFRAANNAWYELNACYWLGLLHAWKGDPRAREHLERSRARARELGIRTHEAECEAALAELAERRA